MISITNYTQEAEICYQIANVTHTISSNNSIDCTLITKAGNSIEVTIHPDSRNQHNQAVNLLLQSQTQHIKIRDDSVRAYLHISLGNDTYQVSGSLRGVGV
ncbi:MAG: hypothetical protein RIQ94_2139 [Pseudomonadota bacterium]|jgi:tRNA A22 N-methylase